MTNRSIVVSVCVFFCIAIMSLGCKKGCGTCKSYGYNNTIQAYSAQVCANNFCTCPNGYEGDSCQIYSVNKYIQPSSTWQVTDGCSGNPNYYAYITTNYPYYSSFFINNLFNSGTQIQVYIQSAPNNQGTGLYIPSQTIGAATFSGTGTYSVSGAAGKITLNMDYNNNGIDQPCIMYLYQQ